MPRSVIATGAADIVLPVRGLIILASDEDTGSKKTRAKFCARTRRSNATSGAGRDGCSSPV